MDSDMPYYRKPEQELEWVPIEMNEKMVPGWRLADYSKLPSNHPVIRRLAEAGMGECKNDR